MGLRASPRGSSAQLAKARKRPRSEKGGLALAFDKLPTRPRVANRRSVCWHSSSARGPLPCTRVYWTRRPLTRHSGLVPLRVSGPAGLHVVLQALVQRGGRPAFIGRRRLSRLREARFMFRERSLRPIPVPRAALLACHVISTHGRFGPCPQWRPRRVPRVPDVASQRTSEEGRERHRRPRPSSCAPRSGVLAGSSPADTGRAFGATSVFRSADVPPGGAGRSLPKLSRYPRCSSQVLRNSAWEIMDARILRVDPAGRICQAGIYP